MISFRVSGEYLVGFI